MTAYVFKRKRPKEYRKTVIDTATAGTYTFDVAKDTTARIILVGGGGAGGQVWEGHSEGGGGGSGACVYCVAKLTAGTYTITNGAAAGSLSGNGGSSTLSLNGSTLITAGGGYGGQGGNGVPGAGGTYSISDNVELEKTIIAGNGNSGGYGGNMVSGAGGASLYKGYGRGGNSRGIGTGGYIFVELTTDETDYDYKIDNDACYVLKRKQYWKKVVTEITKYWKEITTETTTRELAFACYGLQHIKLYAKLPLGSDRYIWATSTTGIATNVNQLSRYPEVFGSISESVATWGGSYPRDYAHDVYKDVTTTVTEVVEGTPDDYTYTEVEIIETAVAGTPEDYDFIVDKSYVLKRN